jgi:hypothetical protein
VFNKSNYQSKPRLYSFYYLTIYSPSSEWKQARYQREEVSEQGKGHVKNSCLCRKQETANKAARPFSMVLSENSVNQHDTRQKWLTSACKGPLVQILENGGDQFKNAMENGLLATCFTLWSCLAYYFPRVWRWCMSSKRRLSINALHGVISQKMEHFGKNL